MKKVPLAFVALFSLFFARYPAAAPGAELPDSIHPRSGFSGFREKCQQAAGPVRVAFLGGSITQNAHGHSAMVPEWLEEQFPDTEFVFTNVGLSSTCSVSGAFRLEDHLLSQGPMDLLIVEFAVNDDQDAGHPREVAIRGMEGVVRHVRREQPGCAILMVHYVNEALLELALKGEDSISIAAHEAVAEHYGITTVNVADALAAAVKSGDMTWETYGGTHPKPEGYRFASGLITTALEAGWSGEGNPALPPLPEKALDPYCYSQGRLVDPQEADWLGGWKFGPVSKDLLPLGAIRKDYEKYDVLRADRPGTMLYYSFSGRTIGAFILAGPDAGIVEISIDGGPWVRQDLYHHYSEKLNYPRSVILADGLSPSYHQMALRVAEEKNPESQGHAASILFLEVNE